MPTNRLHGAHHAVALTLLVYAPSIGSQAPNPPTNVSVRAGQKQPPNNIAGSEIEKQVNAVAQGFHAATVLLPEFKIPDTGKPGYSRTAVNGIVISAQSQILELLKAVGDSSLTNRFRTQIEQWSSDPKDDHNVEFIQTDAAKKRFERIESDLADLSRSNMSATR